MKYIPGNITKHLIFIRCLVFFLFINNAYSGNHAFINNMNHYSRSFSFSDTTINNTEIDTTTVEEHLSDSTDFEESVIDSVTINGKSNNPIDSVINIEDSTIMLFDSSTADAEPADEPDLPWTFDAGLSLKNQQVQNGVALSTGKPVASIDLGLSHSVGFGLSLGGSRSNDKKNPYASSYIGLEYNISVTDWMDLGASYTLNKYNSDTANVMAGANKSLSVLADLYYKSFIFDLSYDYSYGTDIYKYLSPTIIHSIKVWDFRITSMASVTYAWYIIHAQRITDPKILARLKKKFPLKYEELLKKNQITISESGISSVLLSLGIRYPLLDNLGITLTPSYSYTPKEVLSKTSSQFIVTLGLTYSLDF